MRGRVLAVNFMVLGILFPIGTLIQGQIADAIGLRWTTAGSGVVLGVGLVAMAPWQRRAVGSRNVLTRGLHDSSRDPIDPRSARRVHRARDQAARADRRQHALLRSPSRVGAHRLRQRWCATRRLGGAAARDAPSRRRCRLAAARAARRSSVVATPRTWRWRSSANTWRRRGLGLHNDLQNESSIVGNFPTVLMMRDFGTPDQIAAWMPGFLDGTRRLAFGSDRTEPRQRRDVHGDDCRARR